VIEQMELAGVGALLKMIEDRRLKLATEGLFDENRKRPLPFLPGVIGVITSPTGAVIRDILHRLTDRFPVQVLIWPVAVQGENAAAEVTRAINGFNALPAHGEIPRPDVLIVARGGGSIEDLMPFNDEALVRAAAASHIPLISAVGHETDTTLIDYASDRRAPTPTAAAEFAVPVRAELQATLLDLQARITRGLNRHVTQEGERLHHVAARLGAPERLFEGAAQHLDHLGLRLESATTRSLEVRAARTQQLAAKLHTPSQVLREQQHLLDLHTAALGRATQIYLGRQDERLRTIARLIESLSYTRVLERGFALVKDTQGNLVRHGADLPPGTDITLTFGDQITVAATTRKA
jgi:exodeoxyribonuclease VII large subunit